MAKNLFSALFSQEKKDKPYFGTVEFKTNTITFSGRTVLLRNVSKFEQYGIKYIYQIPMFLLVFSIILTIAGLFLLPWGLALILIFGWISYLGIKERLRPKLFGLTIQLNSGTEHTFLSTDKTGIEKLFGLITDAVEKHLPVNYIFNFQDNKVTVSNSQGVAIGDNATVSGNNF